MKRIFSCLVVFTIIIASCKKDKPKTAPSVNTSTLTNVTTSTATAGGQISSDGNSPITAAGIVLSKVHATPTLTDTVLTSTTTTGSFTVNLSNLDFGTTYYIRAYATNNVGTGYGQVVTLNTSDDTTKVRFTYNGQTVVYGVIISPSTQRKWLDRNLGATRAATASNDSLSYGDLFQWGRGADGHQLRTSNTTSTTSSTDAPGSNYITTNTRPDDPYDWRIPQNNNLWQGVNGINNPCPTGWRVPTLTEWAAEKTGGISGTSSAFAILKLPAGGIRGLNGALAVVGTFGWYWSSTTNSYTGTSTFYDSGQFYITSTAANAAGFIDRGEGMAVRCIKD